MMRIATWNLERPRNPNTPRARRLLAEIQAINADIWILTETRENLSPGPEYASAGTQGFDRTGDPGERWTMIWSRLPVLEIIPTSDPIRTVAACIQVGASRTLVIYGTVLPWRSDRRWRPWRGSAAFMYAAGRQIEDWAALRRNYPSAEFCVAGDFNQEFKPPFYTGSRQGQELLAQAMQNLRCTWTTGEHDPLIAHAGGEQQSVDHVCVGRELQERLTGSGVWPDRATFAASKMTDHYGVWLDFS